MLSTRHVVCIVAVLFALSSTSFGQLPTGTPVFGSFDSDGVNTINLGSLNIHTQIPIFSKPGKGIPFSAILNHDNVAWYPSGGRWLYATNGTTTGLDWIGLAPASSGAPAGYAISPALCASGQATGVYKNWSYVDVFNTTHGTLFQLDSAGCLYGTTGNGTSADGYALSASVSQGTTSGTGPNVPTNMSASGSGNAWSSPGNIKFDDGVDAVATLDYFYNSPPSNELKAQGFGFNIPANAVITGIKVEIDRWRNDASAPVRDNDVTLLKAGVPVGANHGISNPLWPTTDTVQAYGSSTDSWGVPFSPADVNAPNFGVQLSAIAAAAGCDPITCVDESPVQAHVDQIRITVYYAVPAVSATVTSPSGMSMSSGSYTDPHGNSVTVSGTSTLNYYDTLSATTPVLTKSGSPSSGLETYTYVGGSGSNVNFRVNYTNYTLQTAFGCSDLIEYSQANFPLATSITLPDGNSYYMAYETTPGFGSTYKTGRLASIQLPTGGIIYYSYTGSNNGINCADGSTIGFTKQTPDTAGTQWTYSRSITSYGSQTTVTSPSPDGNVTIINFDTAGHELQRQIKKGSSTLLKTIIACYNGTAIANCPTQGPGTAAINRITTYAQIADSSGIQSKVDTTYNTIALPTETDTYDWTASTPTTSVVSVYGTCDLIPSFGTNLSMIFAKERGRMYVEEQAHGSADDRGTEAG